MDFACRVYNDPCIYVRTKMKKEIRAEQAHYLVEEIKRIKAEIGKGYFLFGEMFKKIRDDKLYKLTGCQTFTEFIAQPEIAFSHSTVYDYIAVYRVYIEELGINPEHIADITYSKLRRILLVVEKDPEEWLSKARTLSRSDLTMEVRESQGKPEKLDKSAYTTPDLPSARTGQRAYLKWVKQQERCIISGELEPIAHHFPRTKKRGGEAEDWKRIPISMSEHTLSHSKPSAWLWERRRAIFDWFYDTIAMLFEEKEKK